MPKAERRSGSGMARPPPSRAAAAVGPFLSARRGPLPRVGPQWLLFPERRHAPVLSRVASMTVPVYIAEVAPPHLRGRLVTINTLFITGGQFFASVVDGIFSYLAKDGWRYMLGLSAVPAVIQFLGFLFLPESPRWLIQKGQTQRARRILSQMRGNQAIDEEYDSIKNNIEEEENEVGAAGPVICRMLTYPPTRRALIVGCGLQMFQQLSGINTVIYVLGYWLEEYILKNGIA